MEDNYNLDDFLKNKLNDFSDESTDWDRPRGNAWTAATQQLIAQSFQRFKRKALAGSILLGLLLLGLTIYSGYLYKNVQQLEQALATKERDLIEKELALQQQTATLQQLRADCLNSPIVESVTPPQSTKIIVQNVPVPTVLPNEKYENLLATLRDSLQTLQKQLAAQPVPAMAATSLPTVELLPPKPVKFLAIPSATPAIPEIQNTAAFAAKKQEDFQHFEAGLQHSFLSYSVPISSNVANVGSIQGNSEEIDAITNISSLQFGYGLRPNLYLRTGIRYALLELEKTDISGIIYDKTGEFMQSNGTIANNILLESRTSFSDVDQEITVEIPAGTELESGDLLLMTLTNYQTIDFIHIPLGISYFHGKNRWQMEYLGGLVYNYVGIINYQLEAEFQANNINIPIDGIKTIGETETVSQFLTAYAGIGVSYRLSNRWHLRSNLTLEDNTHDFNSQQFFRFNDVRPGLNFSLNYRF